MSTAQVRKPRVVTTDDDVIAMYELMKIHLRKDEATGFVVYDEGWSDYRIAQTVREGLSTKAAINLRVRKFGHLGEFNGAKKNASLEARVEHLEKIVDKMMANAKFQPRLV